MQGTNSEMRSAIGYTVVDFHLQSIKIMEKKIVLRAEKGDFSEVQLSLNRYELNSVKF
jgi:hypothetical protein